MRGCAPSLSLPPSLCQRCAAAECGQQRQEARQVECDGGRSAARGRARAQGQELEEHRQSRIRRCQERRAVSGSTATPAAAPPLPSLPSSLAADPPLRCTASRLRFAGVCTAGRRCSTPSWSRARGPRPRTRRWWRWWTSTGPRSGVPSRPPYPAASVSSAASGGTTTSTPTSARTPGPARRTSSSCRPTQPSATNVPPHPHNPTAAQRSAAQHRQHSLTLRL